MVEYPLEKNNTLVLVFDRGSTVTNFRVDKRDIFFPWQTRMEKARGGCPICAPWFGKSERGPHHGHLRNLENGACEKIDSAAARMFFNRPGDNGYPWPMRYMVTTRLGEEGTMTVMLMIERGKDGIEESAPVNPGFHPYFCCDDAGKVKVWMAGKTYSGFEEKARMIPVEDTQVMISSPGLNMKMLLLSGFRKGHSQLVFWTDNKDKYFCLEPILEDPSLFDTPQGRHLNQGEFLGMSVLFQVL